MTRIVSALSPEAHKALSFFQSRTMISIRQSTSRENRALQFYVVKTPGTCMSTIQSHTPTPAPAWAVLERRLFDTMDQAAPLFIDKYTRPGGSLVWTESYPGDGVWADDLYEAFFNWPVFYALGGSEYTSEMAVHEWNALTRQITYDYGRASREFINDDDWFHNSENYIYFYALGLSDPTNTEMMRRARRFAGFYLAEDPQVPNYDPEHRIIRSPFSGSKGPLFHARFDDVRYNLEHGHLNLAFFRNDIEGYIFPKNSGVRSRRRADLFLYQMVGERVLMHGAEATFD